MSQNYTYKYAMIQFYESNAYTKVDRAGKIVTLTEEEALSAPSIGKNQKKTKKLLITESDIDDAENDVWYAIETNLLEAIYGITVDD